MVSHSGVSLLFVNLDGIKRVNDSEGILLGDELIRLAAKRMHKFSLMHGGYIAHLTGDEFFILFEGKDHDSLNEVANELLEDNQRPFKVEGIDYYLNSSIGISSLAANDISFSKMVQESGIAMGESKRMGENQYIHFTDIEKRSLYLSILDMEKDLRYAIDNDGTDYSFSTYL